MYDLLLLLGLLLTFGGCIGFYLASVSYHNQTLARILAVACAIGLVILTAFGIGYSYQNGGEWWWTLSYLAFACVILHLAFKKYPRDDGKKSDDETPRNDRPD